MGGELSLERGPLPPPTPRQGCPRQARLPPPGLPPPPPARVAPVRALAGLPPPGWLPYARAALRRVALVASVRVVPARVSPAPSPFRVAPATNPGTMSPTCAPFSVTALPDNLVLLARFQAFQEGTTSFLPKYSMLPSPGLHARVAPARAAPAAFPPSHPGYSGVLRPTWLGLEKPIRGLPWLSYGLEGVLNTVVWIQDSVGSSNSSSTSHPGHRGEWR